jgi:hypothetical protein
VPQVALQHRQTQSAAALRVSGVVQDTGIAMGLITSPFGGRDSLESAAQQQLIFNDQHVDSRRRHEPTFTRQYLLNLLRFKRVSGTKPGLAQTPLTVWS